MRALDRKLLRDVWRMRGQVLSIAAVVACGIAAVLAMGSTIRSVERARDDFYERARFADVFATLERAPEPVARRLAAIPGVAAVETRVALGAVLSVPGLDGPATAFVQSAPEGDPALNALHIRRGRMVAPGDPDEVLVGEHFAVANHLEVGDTLGAVLDGRRRTLRIVGIALSPEFVHAVAPGFAQFGDSRHSAILWMSRAALAPAAGMEGAFDGVAVSLAPGASEAAVIERIDALLAPYGGGRAVPRARQASHQVVTGEIRQLRAFGVVMPAVFLLVAAFLLELVLARLVAAQRQEIAVLKAFGYGDRSIAAHFLGYALVVVAVGSIVGVPLGAWAGSRYTALYEPFFRLPELRHDVGVGVVILAVLVSAGAAALGALRAVRAAAALPPAEGMRPPSPARFRPLLLERVGGIALLPPSVRMVLRNVERRPLRALASATGVAMAAAILVAGIFAFDVVRWLVHVQFRLVERGDVSVVFSRPLPARVVHELAAIAGVRRAESFRSVPVRVRAGHRSRQIVVVGLDADATLRRLADVEGRVHGIPPAGAVLTTSLARTLGVAPGDTVRMELLERGGAERRVAVAALLDEMLGQNAYMELGALNQLVGEGPVVSGASLALEPGAEPATMAALRERPGVAGASTRRATMESFVETTSGAFVTTTILVSVLAAVIAVGVLYNGARIALSERGRELASLRVLGFTRREVAGLLLGEQAVIDAVGTPLGLLLGVGLAHAIAVGFESELYRFPVIVTVRTHLFAVAIVVGAAVAAGLAMRRRIDALDMIEVLKTRE